MLTAIPAAALLGIAVWLLIAPASRTRLEVIHGGSARDVDSVKRFLSRRKTKPVTVHERLTVALRTLSAELRAGSTPGEALARSAGAPPLWPNALAAARFGDPVDSAFAADAILHPSISGPLRQLAASWHVGVMRGSGLAVSVERLTLSLRAQQELQTTLRNELAAPRATSRMLAFLPVIGVAMGYLLGANPIAWFLGSPVGLSILLVAVLLTIVGAVWTRAIVRRVERGLV